MNLLLCPNESEHLASGEVVPYIISDDLRAPVEAYAAWRFAPPKPFHMPELRADLIRRSAVIRVKGFILSRRSASLDLRYYYRDASSDMMHLAAFLSGDAVHLLTTEANTLIQPMSDRMPVILTREEAAIWINPLDPDVEGMMRMVRPAALDRLSTYRIDS